METNSMCRVMPIINWGKW